MHICSRGNRVLLSLQGSCESAYIIIYSYKGGTQLINIIIIIIYTYIYNYICILHILLILYLYNYIYIYTALITCSYNDRL